MTKQYGYYGKKHKVVLYLNQKREFGLALCISKPSKIFRGLFIHVTILFWQLDVELSSHQLALRQQRHFKEGM